MQHSFRPVGTPDLQRLSAHPAVCEQELREAAHLEPLVRRALAAGLDIDVIAMDEYTHDVLLPLATDLVVVLDAT